MKGIITIEYLTARIVRQDQAIEDLTGRVRDLEIIVKVLLTAAVILLAVLFSGGM